ncbi:MAG: 16S rRNA (cytosine(1402)-N(4))-methyltransferase RsmH [Planctomycetota bacterium]
MAAEPDNPSKPKNAGKHLPVLMDAVLEHLDPKPGERAIDATAGLGGHATAIGERLGPGGRLLINDLDPAHVDAAADRVRSSLGSGYPKVITVHGNFADVRWNAGQAGFEAADVLLADLGFASPHVDQAERGFAFRKDGPLDMRYDQTGDTATAAELVNTLPEQELASLLREFGEERSARRIAAKVVAVRAESPITSTSGMAEVVHSAIGPRSGGIDSATRTFQALRIAVNDELGSLKALLDAVTVAARAIASDADSWLTAGARIGIISFHSLEDRLVKQSFNRLVADDLGEVVSRRPIVATETEASDNPRARSAKLRVVRLGHSR